MNSKIRATLALFLLTTLAGCATSDSALPVPVPIPPEIYQYLEKFVVSHFVPQERKKRKRKNWSETPG